MEPFIAEIMMFAGNFAPRGWALCDGQLLPIAQNAALFSLLGTTYGGDGRTTFALPDLRGRTPIHPGTGPRLSRRRLGEEGGSETAQPRGVQASGPVKVEGTAAPVVEAADSQPQATMQPYLAVNFVIALQGVYPSRN